MNSEHFKEIAMRHLMPSIEMFELQFDRILDLDDSYLYFEELCHVMEGLDYWLSKTFPFINRADGAAIIENFLQNTAVMNISADDIRTYWKNVKKNLNAFMQIKPAADMGDAAWTAYDTIILQIRHFQYHVGSLDQRLHDSGHDMCSWKGYLE